MATSTTAISQNAGYPSSKVPAAVGNHAILRLSRIQLVEVCLDVLTALCAIELSFYLAQLSMLHLQLHASQMRLHAAALVVSAVLVVLLDRAGAYRIGGSLLGLRETACILNAVFYASMMFAPCALFLGVRSTFEFGGLTIVLLSLFLIIQKQAYCALLFYIRSRRAGLYRAAVYGHAENAIPVLDALLRSPKSRLLPTVCFSDAHSPDYARAFERNAAHVNIYSPERFNEETLRSEGVNLVVIASPMASSAQLKYVIDQSKRAGATILFGAEPHSPGSVQVDYFELDGRLLYGIHTANKRTLYDALKRALDISASSLLLVITGIPMLLAAAAIMLDTRGPVLFRQTRIGTHGKPFTILKFRSMHTEMCGYKTSPLDSADPRITRVGRWLRKSSIDELPQLLNILRGDMTLVGPRPEMPFIVATYSEIQMRRLAIKPGLTGIWQISEDRRYPIHENMHYDLYYLKYRSISLDIAIMLHTALFAVRGV
ncbi:exopolysaccharide biosynthesis polyprenyl glycosylphosphotransferase [Granulicella paludicola]|jgi:exopolysaccharide biosynthesis polyprenyl glycosylphosphotransferase|uniref:exopolysaccharide biosynthesis polyprenyl glycosylphosphotransferase n=1 Tax=Granulicella paludicola TaxID=474951 RepID=UPI0021DFF71B|nr:exopolysaccharide biosynthesis polyprenyl glycosylphosphotransferase [Granulicella paludicola]